MITRRGMALLGGAVLLWGLGRALGVPELFVAALTAGLLVGAGAVVVWTSTPTVAARRSIASPRILHGGATEVHIDLRNDARWDAVALMLVEDTCPALLVDHPPRFVVGGLRPGRVQPLRYELQGTRRGHYTVGPVQIRVRDTGVGIEAALLAKSFGLTNATRFINLLDAGPAYKQTKEDHAIKRERGFEVELEIPLYDFGETRVREAEQSYMRAVNQLLAKAVNVRSEARDETGWKHDALVSLDRWLRQLPKTDEVVGTAPTPALHTSG